MVEVTMFSSGRARLRVGLRSPVIVDRGRSCGTVGVTQTSLSTNRDHHHVWSSGWSLRWNPVHHCKTFHQSRDASLLIVCAFKAGPCRKTPSRAATDQQGSAFGQRSNSRRLRISLHEGLSRYCLLEQKDVIQSELNHVSSNIKDGLLLLRSPQYDAMLSRNRNPPCPGCRVLSPGGHCHQRRPYPPPPWSSPHLPLPKHFRIRPRIPSQPPSLRDGERRSNLLRWYWMRT